MVGELHVPVSLLTGKTPTQEAEEIFDFTKGKVNQCCEISNPILWRGAVNWQWSQVGYSDFCHKWRYVKIRCATFQVSTSV
jgi:hypothetical protein